MVRPQVIQVPVGASATTSTSGDVVTLCPLPQQEATTTTAVVGHGPDAGGLLQVGLRKQFSLENSKLMVDQIRSGFCHKFYAMLRVSELFHSARRRDRAT